MTSSPPLVVIGAGASGMAAALAAANAGLSVWLFDASHDHGASELAQGGLAAAVSEDDHWLLHADDTRKAGEGRGHRPAIRRLTRQAPRLMHWLKQHGVHFDSHEHRPRLGREAAHSRARILHCGGDNSGANLVRSLRQRVNQHPAIFYRPGHHLVGLCLRGERASGVVIRHPDGQEHPYSAAHVILASGGAGGLFTNSTQPPGNIGEAMALAISAGAKTHDVSVFQFHPTAFAAVRQAGRCVLISEALRGAGARLLDHHGKPLGDNTTPIELQARHIVARAVARANANGGAWLDAGPIGPSLTDQFPAFTANCARFGLNPHQPVTIQTVVHYHIGGLRVDRLGRTSLDGLLACGEAAATGLHGSNRLASNSLPEAIHGGIVCARTAARDKPPTSHAAERTVAMAPFQPQAYRDTISATLGMLRQRQRLIAWKAELLDIADQPMGRLLLTMVDNALELPASYGCHQITD